MRKGNRTFYVLIDKPQANLADEVYICEIESDFLESEIKLQFPEIYPLLKNLQYKADKLTFESPSTKKRVVVELIKY